MGKWMLALVLVTAFVWGYVGIGITEHRGMGSDRGGPVQVAEHRGMGS